MLRVKPFHRESAVNPWHDVDPDDGALPGRFLAIIEIPLGSSHKYELDERLDY
jgi:hypothetical protein